MESVVVSDLGVFCMTEQINQLIYRLDFLLRDSTTNLRVLSEHQA